MEAGCERPMGTAPEHRRRMQGQGKGNWQEANRRCQLQIAIHLGLLISPSRVNCCFEKTVDQVVGRGIRGGGMG